MMKSKYLIFGILILVIIGIVFISGCVSQQPQIEKKQTEITAVGEKELKIAISPSVENMLSNEVTIKLISVPKETTAVAFVLVPEGEQFTPQHILWWDQIASDGWDYVLDTSGVKNGAYSIIVMPVKRMGDAPLEIASASVVIQNEEARFVPPPSTSVEYLKSLSFSEYTTISSDIKKAKELGASVITLAFNLDISNDNQVKIPTDSSEGFKNLKKKLFNLINEAHSQGLQVELRTAVVPESTGATDTEKLLQTILPFMKEWAQFAEEHKVYSFTTFGEVDDGKHGKDIDRLNAAVLSEVKKSYTGKVGVGFCCTYSKIFSPEGKESLYDVRGYDYIIISIYPGSGGDALGRYYQMLEPAITDAREMAEKSGVNDVYIGEVGVLNSGETTTFFYTAVVSPEQEAEFYERLFATTNKIVDGYSLPYNFPIGTIKDQSAEKVVSEWYGKLS